ncbi:MAG: FAD-dependent oxidoreductase, partial [Phycisphaerales bacterium]|nr:FAD-dependent oxidoreductase [Phycisphaerales bacterium]
MTVHIMPGEVDCLVLGGGITGAGVARDAAMRGLRTVLVDSHDFASGTSHLTSKLIHGGLRYLEHCHFRLVAEGIVERDRLLNRMAPNLVAPLRFVIPFEGSRFPKWLLTVCGLQLYGLAEWLRSGRRSSPLLAAGMKRHYPALLPHPFGVNFWDAQTNDARLVMATVRTAYAAGAAVHNYTSVTDVARDKDGWNVRLRCELDDREWTLRARSIINATGPWSPMTARRLGVEPQELLWVKGSHLLLRRPPDFGRDAVIINSVRDRRALWIIPWETRLIVGSTESLYRGDLR